MSKTLQTPAVAPEQINSGFFDATACYGIFGREIILLTAPHAAAMYFIHDKRHSVHIEACKAFLGGKILIFCPSWSHFWMFEKNIWWTKKSPLFFSAIFLHFQENSSHVLSFKVEAMFSEFRFLNFLCKLRLFRKYGQTKKNYFILERCYRADVFINNFYNNWPRKNRLEPNCRKWKTLFGSHVFS